MPTARSGRRCRSGAAQRGRALGPAAVVRRPLKFVVKEPIIPAGANKGVFLLAPLVTAVLALSAWAVIPVNDGWVDRRHQCRQSSTSSRSPRSMVYGVIMAGWASNSKYPVPGALRSAAQMVSYEGLDRLRHHHGAAVRGLAQPVRDRRGAGRQIRACSTGTGCRCSDVRDLLHLGAGRDQPPPFDLVEAESELVAGFAVEYSSTPVLLFFLGEYIAICTMCAMATILFLGGWLPPFRCRRSPGSRA
jgi:NADH-quinone oxidoreductase subunit H